MSGNTEPIFVSPDVDRFFKKNIVIPFAHPEQYHPDYAPIPWIHAMFGREGVEKLKTIEALINKYNIDSFDVISVRLGHTTDALNYMISQKRAVQVEEGVIGPVHLLVIDHADILCYEPDDEASMLAAIDLKELQTKNIMLVALFDRLPGYSDPTKITPYAKECQAKFFNQFFTMAYMPAPDADFRIVFIKHIMTEFFSHLRDTTKREFTFEMSDNEYTMLADCSTFATKDNIRMWLRNVFYDIIQNNVTEINFRLFEDHMKKSTDTPHICNYDARQVENEFSTACGKGPIAKPRNKIVATKPDANLNVTGFTTDAVDLEKATKTLKKQKKHSKKRERDDEEDETNQVKTNGLEIKFEEGVNMFAEK